MALTPENYSQGFLIDEELMAGITESPDHPGAFMAYVIQHTTGESLGSRTCPTLEDALALINQIPRSWAFERTKGCDGSKCEAGTCKGEGCKVFSKPRAAAREAGSLG
jgi:hypothetical protein